MDGRHGYRMGSAALLLVATLQVAAINPVSGGMPNRISMNVTVPKQTQGATFGEKVNSGLHAAGSAVASGGAIVIECGHDACAMVLPDGQGFRADTRRLTVRPLAPAEVSAVRRGTPATSASLLGGAVPGAGILSAAVSAVANLAGSGGGAAAASYAATGRMEGGKEGLATANVAPGVLNVVEPLVDGDYILVVVAAAASGGLKDTLKTQVRTAATQPVRIEVGFSVQQGVLKTRHDTVKNSIGNIR